MPGALAAKGLFADDVNDILERHVGHELSKGGGLSRRTDAIELASQLPEEHFHRVLAAIKGREARRRIAQSRVTMELVDPGLARIIAEGVAAYAEAATTRVAHDPDQMLRRLVREGLFHVQRERRHLAAVLLGLSPYGRAVAQSVLSLTKESDEQLASLCWSLLRRMGHVIERDEVAAIACNETRTGLQARGFVTAGLVPRLAQRRHRRPAVEPPPARARPPRSSTPRCSRSAWPTTRTWSRSARSEPELSRRGALWWRTIGSSLHDDDVPPEAARQAGLRGSSAS